jgi:biopolymer transport protein ExbB
MIAMSMLRKPVRLLAACAFAAAILVARTGFAADLGDVAKQLTADIKQAQAQLSSTQAQIGRERAQLAQELNKAQSRVLELRDKTAAARRLADEKTLGIEQIEARLDNWQEQGRFQKRLVTGFLDKVGQQSAGEGKSAEFADQLNRLQQFVEAQQANLRPQWQTRQILLPDGKAAEGKLLALGPVQWFLQPERTLGGLATTTDGVTSARLELDGAATRGLLVLSDKGDGTITFDPTLTRVLKLADSRETLWDQLVKGGLWVIPIVGFGLFAAVIAIAKGVYLYRLPRLQPALAARVRTASVAGPAALAALRSQLQGAQAELLGIAVGAENQTHRDEQLYVCLLRWRHKLEHWLGSIALTASVSPLLGLIGTVSGMITTFKLMTVFGSSDASTVSAGISEAMITTKLGLVVAVPSLIAHALMSRRVKNYFAELENLGVELSQLPSAEARRDV